MESRLMRTYKSCPRVIQTSGINIVEMKKWAIDHSSGTLGFLRSLQEAQSWSKEDFLDYQSTRLRQMVRFAFEYVPFYKRLYTAHGVDVSSIRSPADLEKLPTVSKEDVVRSSNDFYPRLRVRYDVQSTSGTTGKPLKIRVSDDALKINRASSLLRDHWAGYRGELMARFVGDKPVSNCDDKQLYRKSYVMNRLFFPSFCLSAQNSRRILDDLKAKKVKFLMCYPSAGFVLAKFLEQNDEYLPMSAILYSSEPMHPYEKEIMEERFQCKTFGFYGQAESAVSASECEQGSYHLAMLDGILEIMKGEEIMGPGEHGSTVVTSLWNEAMPLIRYRLNDYSGYSDEVCGCGRTTPTLYSVEAKADDLILTPSGRIISPCAITSTYKNAEHIMEAQIIQNSADSITVKIVPQADFSSEDEANLNNALQTVLCNEFSLRIEKVGKIHSSGTYKKRRVVNDMPGDLFERAFREGRGG